MKQKAIQKTPKQTTIPDNLFDNPLEILTQLKRFAEEADAKRLSVMVDAFAQDYPELYQFISGLVDETPQEAMRKLSLRWPAMETVPVFLPSYPQVIIAIQNQIKQRRDS